MGRVPFVSIVCMTILIAAEAQAQSNFVQSQLAFGSAVDVSDGRIFVGEPLNQRVPGMTYVFERGESNWRLAAALKGADGYIGDNFGSSLAGSRDLLFVGAIGSPEKHGAVYVFNHGEDGTWAETGKIHASDKRPGDQFGRAVSFGGDRLFVANRPLDGPPSVYAFRLDSGSNDWVQEAVIRPDEEANNSTFAADIATNGSLLFVGSPRDGSGVVHVYGPTSGSGWSKITELRAGGGAPSGAGGSTFDAFGSKLFLAGNQLFVTAPNADRFTGKAYSFLLAEDGGFKRGPSFTPFDAKSAHGFARDLALASDELVVSAMSPNGMKGGVYLMRLTHNGEDVMSAAKLYEPQTLPSTFYGEALDAEGDVLVVAANQDGFRSGAVYVYERDKTSGSWSSGQKILAPKAEGYTSVRGKKTPCEDGSAGGFGCERVDLVSFLTTDDLGISRGILTNDVWGWTDPETGKEYAIVGRNDGTTFVDLSDPVNPVTLGFLPRTAGTPPTIWRDMKVYKDHVFIVADQAGAHGVQIFDLRQLRDLSDVPVEFEETAHYDGIFSAHNIVINEETGFAYTVGNSGGGETCGGGSHIINVQEPTNPTFAGCFAHAATGRAGTGYTHDAQCVTYAGPDERYTGREICFAANETAISISDVSDKGNTVAIARGDYPNAGYTHQGWLSENHRYFFVNDELDEINGSTDGTRTLIWDVAELDDPILVNEYVSSNKATDHNLYIRGQYMYQSNYVSGLRIVDVSNVEAPVEVGHFDTVPWGVDKPGFGGSWSNYPFFKSGLIIATSAEEGLFVLKRSEVGS